MQRNKEVPVSGARNADPLAQRNENVGISSELHAITAAGFQHPPEFLRDIKNEILFADTRLAMRSGIDPAMPRVDNDRLLAVASRWRIGSWRLRDRRNDARRRRRILRPARMGNEVGTIGR